MSVALIMSQLGAHLKAMRKLHVLREHARLATNAAHNRRLLLSNSGDAAYSTSDDEEAAAYAQDVTHLDDDLVPAIEAAFTAYRTNLETPTSWFGVLAAELGLDADDLDDPIDYEYSVVNGAVAISKRIGTLGQWYEEMVRQKYVVVANKITAGSLVPDDDNVGTLEITDAGTGAFLSNCPSGKFTFICTDASISAPKFSVRFVPTKAAKLADGTGGLEATNELTAEQVFADGEMGIKALVLSRTTLDNVDEQNDNGGILSAYVVTNPQDSDSDEGKFYFTIFHDVANWHLYVYRLSSRASSAVVGAAHFAIDTGTEAITVTCSGGTVLEFTFDHDAAIIALPDTDDLEEDLYIDIGGFAEGDEWTLDVTNDYAGNFSTKIMQAWRVALPAGPAKPATECGDALAGAGAGNVDNGSYLYVYSYVSPLGESGQSAPSNGVTVADKTVNGKVDLTSITVGPSGTTARKVYRSNDAGATYHLLTTINDNSTTTYQDNVAQATIASAAAPLTEVDEDYASSVQMD